MLKNIQRSRHLLLLTQSAANSQLAFASLAAANRLPHAASLMIAPKRGFAYHKNVLDHYENPRNVGSLDKKDPNVGTGLVGAPACGDVMKL
jgi:iron-sulfur cluster assembly enzyme ISCU, mitochondrial